ncbi:MauE/DoxX family redox-associated membrane protein [Actinomadura hibisca]|uniref:MauE/DoxX family redox-associated membrane protein n=1 Tax=Actinomadura hibisca TaxID=68565 RepID=UPI00082D1C6E|nr:MauE/DoxX family redox-associated membrane protein [Actinomadura hibisca]
MVTVVQNAQVLLLAAVLLAACLAKLAVRAPAEADHVHGVPLPAGARQATVLRNSRSAGVGLGVMEGVLGLALLVTSHVSVRIATAVGFAVATWAVSELRAHRPDAGCGCFGGLSTKPVGRRTVARAMLLTAAAVASLWAPYAGLDVLRFDQARVGLALVLAVELALFAALSPELATLFGRHARPRTSCARRRSPLAETYATLRDSRAWARHENAVTSAVPVDVWREGCWRFLVFPGRRGEQALEIVFAVSTAERDREVRAAVVDAGVELGAGAGTGADHDVPRAGDDPETRTSLASAAL